MQLTDFKIGMEFRTGSGLWRCTDIGTRTIIAIQIDVPTEVVRYSQRTGKRRVLTNDKRWFNGPPYAVTEHVFDEQGLLDCRLV